MACLPNFWILFIKVVRWIFFVYFLCMSEFLTHANAQEIFAQYKWMLLLLLLFII